MNGFKILCIFLLFSSCTQRYIAEQEGQALYLVYRNIQQNISEKLSVWKSPNKYLNDVQNSLAPSTQKLLALFPQDYIVIRLGAIRGNYIINDISYRNSGASLEIVLGVSDKLSDIGYPIFLKNKKINHITVYSNETIIYTTNLTLP
ncbi:MAG: hypothetical protein ACRCWI_00265 [Brevinema sp.]